MIGMIGEIGKIGEIEESSFERSRGIGEIVDFESEVL